MGIDRHGDRFVYDDELYRGLDVHITGRSSAGDANSGSGAIGGGCGGNNLLDRSKFLLGKKMKDWQRYLKNIVSLELDVEKCIGCGLCEQVCPHRVFAIEDRKALIVDRDACMECGACGRNCPVEAISVDAGVGCASAIIKGAITGTEPSCGCDEGGSSCC